MKKPNRISMSLFDDELKALINASAKIFPITQLDIDTNNNPKNYEYGKVDRSIYVWHNSKWEYVIADDADINWIDIKGKPISYPSLEHIHPNDHNHLNKLLLDVITKEMVANWNTILDKANKSYVDAELLKKANILHEHPYANVNHNHDVEYYKKSVIDTMLSAKADKVHDHNGLYYSKNEVDIKVNGKSDKDHTHDFDPTNHINNVGIHVTDVDKANWNNKSPFKYEEDFLELRNHYGYMNINGGDFDGNDGYYIMYDGGMF